MQAPFDPELVTASVYVVAVPLYLLLWRRHSRQCYAGLAIAALILALCALLRSESVRAWDRTRCTIRTLSSGRLELLLQPHTDLSRLLVRAACTFDRAGRGSHQIWQSPITGRFPVPVRIVSRHTANGALEQTGLPRPFDCDPLGPRTLPQFALIRPKPANG